MFEKVHCLPQTSRFCYIFRHEEPLRSLRAWQQKKAHRKAAGFWESREKSA